jgi:aspartyl-tRNA(Asn)/glutamyl-tRNA(Gln) amidotransferase subunit C
MVIQRKNQRISRKEVEHVAWLAHIKLTAEEVTLFTEQFIQILNYFTRIDKVETKGIPPTYHVLDLINVKRKDEPKESLHKDLPLKNAPKIVDNFLKSPRIV